MPRRGAKTAAPAPIVRAILDWYGQRGRDLPWRDIREPYRILVAEIMLQQTQVSRVLTLYGPFLKRFPTLRSLARADRSDVIIAWRGLGYNNRAVRLHALAQQLVRSYRGKIPAELSVLSGLPGIGTYTAHALLVSVHGRDVPVVDVNVRRVLSRLFWPMRTTLDLRPDGEIWEIARGLVVPGRAYDWSQALMDLGATICTARTPACPECPVGRYCRSAGSILHTTALSRKREPSLGGVPNRIYRGRVIELLRLEGGRAGLRARTIGEALLPRFQARHERWLRKLIKGLERDGLVRLREDRRFHQTLIWLA